MYAADAPELQLRALADLAYLVQVGALIDTPTPLDPGKKNSVGECHAPMEEWELLTSK